MINKIKIGGFGSPFSHDLSSCHCNPPQKFEWEFNIKNDIEVYMDYNIIGGLNSSSKNKFLWLCESKELFKSQYEYIKNNLSLFKNCYKKIFTHCHDLLNVDDCFEYCPPASNKSWIIDGKIYKKTKLVSMICSGACITEGHIFRNNLMNSLKNQNAPVDFFGRSHNPFSKKEEALADYCFSFVIENGSYPHYYTEKVMDCFACGTIPIYWGSPLIHKDFDTNGILLFNENFNFNELSLDLYFSKLEYVNQNFLKEKNHQIADDVLFNKIQNYI